MENSSSAFDPQPLLEHAAWARSLARSLVLDDSRADDLVQNAWLTILRRRPSEIQNPRAWFGGMLRKLASEGRRAEKRLAHRERVAACREAIPSTATLAEQASLQRRIVGLVLELDEPYRSVVLLRFFQELPPNEIALRLGVPAPTVYTQLRRAMDRMREKLDAEFGGRKQWGLAMLPLAKPGEIGSSEGEVVGSLKRKGNNMMTLVLKGSIALSLALGSFATYSALRPAPARPQQEQAAISSKPQNDAPLVRSEAEPVRAPVPEKEAEPAKTPGAQDPKAPKLAALAVRVLDPAGAPLAKLRLACFTGATSFSRWREKLPRILDGEEKAWDMNSKEKQDEDTVYAPVKTAESDRDGRLTFDPSGFPSTFYIASATPGFEVVLAGWTKTAEGKRGDYVVVLGKPFGVDGQVVDENGAPVAGAKVTLMLQKDSIKKFPIELTDPRNFDGPKNVWYMGDWAATTNATGWFHMPGVPRVDSAIVGVSHDRFDAAPGEMQSFERGTELRFALKRK